jgi:hypothetical protein
MKGNIRLENLWLNQMFCTKLQTTARERHIVSERGVQCDQVFSGEITTSGFINYYIRSKINTHFFVHQNFPENHLLNYGSNKIFPDK